MARRSSSFSERVWRRSGPETDSAWRDGREKAPAAASPAPGQLPPSAHAPQAGGCSVPTLAGKPAGCAPRQARIPSRPKPASPEHTSQAKTPGPRSGRAATAKARPRRTRLAPSRTARQGRSRTRSRARPGARSDKSDKQETGREAYLLLPARSLTGLLDKHNINARFRPAHAGCRRGVPPPPPRPANRRGPRKGPGVKGRPTVASR